MIWRCEDCRRIGFCWDKTPQQVQDEHMKDCEANKNPAPPNVQEEDDGD
jgi:hypothetical protein